MRVTTLQAILTFVSACVYASEPLKAEVLRDATADRNGLFFTCTIDEKPVRLLIDTGAPLRTLFRPAADRLGIRSKQYKDKDYAITDTVEWATESWNAKTEFVVFDAPEQLTREVDGVFGWHELRSGIFSIDSTARRIRSTQNCLTICDVLGRHSIWTLMRMS